MPKVEIKAVPKGLYTSVTGWIDGKMVVEVSNEETGVWRLFDALTIPMKFDEALAYAECVHRTLQRAREYGAE